MKVKELKKYLERFKENDELCICVPYLEAVVSLDAPNTIIKKGKITILSNKKNKSK